MTLGKVTPDFKVKRQASALKVKHRGGHLSGLRGGGLDIHQGLMSSKLKFKVTKHSYLSVCMCMQGAKCLQLGCGQSGSTPTTVIAHRGE